MNWQIHFVPHTDGQQAVQVAVLPLLSISLLNSGGLDKWINCEHEKIAPISVGI